MISDIVSNRDTHVNKYTVYLKPVINTCIVLTLLYKRVFLNEDVLK